MEPCLWISAQAYYKRLKTTFLACCRVAREPSAAGALTGAARAARSQENIWKRSARCTSLRHAVWSSRVKGIVLVYYNGWRLPRFDNNNHCWVFLRNDQTGGKGGWGRGEGGGLEGFRLIDSWNFAEGTGGGGEGVGGINSRKVPCWERKLHVSN